MMDGVNKRETGKKPFVIAIDGPAGAGKSTLAAALAAELDFAYINTGLIYRAMSYTLLQQKDRMTVEELEAVLEKDVVEENKELRRVVDAFVPEIKKNNVYIEGNNVTAHLRTGEIDKVVGIAAKYMVIRQRVSEIQRSMIEQYKGKGIVVEGRDIGTKIVPDAQLKIFLVASIEERAKRRAIQNKSNDIEQIEQELKERDKIDTNRAHSPLAQAKDAVLVDNTDSTIEDIVQKVKDVVVQRMATE